MSATSTPHVLVCGDVALDWFDRTVPPTPASKATSNFELYTGIARCVEPGGACLLYQMLAALSGVTSHGVSSFDCRRMARVTSGYVNSYMHLKEFPRGKDEDKKIGNRKAEDKTWRVDEFCGYQPAAAPAPSFELPPPSCRAGGRKGCPERHCPKGALDAVLFDDVGNQFRQTPAMWQGIEKHLGKKTLLVYKLSRPIAPSCVSGGVPQGVGDSELWKTLVLGREWPVPPVVLIDARDLRNEGCPLCTDLSWERAAVDCVKVLRPSGNEGKYGFLRGFHVVVRFDLDGALVLPAESVDHPHPDYSLVYDPKGIDGAFDRSILGRMIGYSGAFAAALTRCLLTTGGTFAKDPGSALAEGSKQGLAYARNLLVEGMGPSEQQAAPDPRAAITKAAQGLDAGGRAFHIAVIPRRALAGGAKPGWSILGELTPAQLQRLAMAIVKTNAAPEEQGIPVARLGKTCFVDREEIECFRTMERLVLEYRDNHTEVKPLCLAVFGPPGSGKSFAVKQVVKPLLGDRSREFTFNLSEFTSPHELARAFHLVHDHTRDGSVPLVFFDEFDASLGGQPLGWLKYMLAPMQDGAFNDGTDVHPIGKAVFVFAGGTSHAYADFANRSGSGVDFFIAAKGPDFLSRLRGYVDIAGANPAKPLDYGCMIRRALVLRYQLDERAKSLGTESYRLREANKHMKIDDEVLRAFLKVPVYLHGMRSLGAIVEVSRLSGARGFSQTALPPTAVLRMHTDADRFQALLEKDMAFLACREQLAEQIHQNYLREYGPGLPDGDPAKQPWAKLPEYLCDSNRAQADDLPLKLAAVNKGIEPAYLPGTGAEFSEEDIQKLARMERKRWVAEKLAQGWEYGPVKDSERMIHDALLPDDKLPCGQFDKDISAVRAIPALLAKVGCRLCELPPPSTP